MQAVLRTRRILELFNQNTKNWDSKVFQLQPLKCWKFCIILGWSQYFKICPLNFFWLVEALDGSFSFYVSIKGSKKTNPWWKYNRFVWAFAHGFCIFYADFDSNRITLRLRLYLRYSILLLFFKMHLLIFKCCGFYNDF